MNNFQTFVHFKKILWTELNQFCQKHYTNPWLKRPIKVPNIRRVPRSNSQWDKMYDFFGRLPCFWSIIACENFHFDAFGCLGCQNECQYLHRGRCRRVHFLHHQRLKGWNFCSGKKARLPKSHVLIKKTCTHKKSTLMKVIIACAQNSVRSVYSVRSKHRALNTACAQNSVCSIQRALKKHAVKKVDNPQKKRDLTEWTIIWHLSS